MRQSTTAKFLLLFAFMFSLAAEASCDAELLQKFTPLTLKSLEELATQSVKNALNETPAPEFFHLAKLTQIEQKGTLRSPGLSGQLPPGLSFVPAPAPTSPGPMVVSLSDPKQSVVLHMDLPWHGRTTATTVYASLPEALPLNNDGYLIGPENPVVVFHIHGGGTPSATGKSAMSIGADLAKAGYPVIAIDMPGHGRATRSLEGLTTFEGQVDWTLEALKKLVHPKVKVIISGHSWGGEFALYMFLHSKEAKYRDANIQRFISLSSPIDVSLGGDPKSKMDFEKWLDEHWDEYESRTAATDFEFKKNILVNGKISDVGSYFTAFTEFDFKTPVLTPEQQKGLIPVTMWTGAHDGLVYVGREEAYNKFGNSLAAPSEYNLLGPGMTWASKSAEDLKPTGHGLWDRFVEGTTRHQTYQMVVDRAKEVAAGQEPAKAQPDQAWMALNETIRTYANFIAFREMAANLTVYLRRSVGDVTAMNQRRVELFRYLKTIEGKTAANTKEVEAAVRTATDALKAELGLEKALTLGRAQEELSSKPLTEEQRAAYQAYIDRVNEIDRLMPSKFSNSEFEDVIAQLEREFGTELKKAGIAKVAEYRPAYEKYAAMKNANKEEAALRSRLAALHQRYLDAVRLNQLRFAQERDRQVAELEKPAGIKDHGDALRQMKREFSAERTAKLTAFVTRYADAEATGRAQAGELLSAAISAIPKPANSGSIEEIEKEWSGLNALLELTLVPEGNEEAQALVDKIKALEVDRLNATQGTEGELSLEKLAKSLNELKDRRKGLLSKWEGLWRDEKVHSPLIAQEQEKVVGLLLNYADLYKASEDKKGSGLLALKESGTLTAENVVTLAKEVDPALTAMLTARDAHLAAMAALEKLTWSEAAAGRLEGATEEAQRIATQITELTAQIKALDEKFEVRRRLENLAVQERDASYFAYLNLMRGLGIEMPFRLERVRIQELLDLPADQLLARLRSDSAALEAIQKCLNLWQEFASRIREDDQRKGETVE